MSLWDPGIPARGASVKAADFDDVEIQNLEHDVSPHNVLKLSFYFTKNTLPLRWKHRWVNAS